MDQELTLARLDGGRSVVDPDTLVTILATPAAADHLGAWTAAQATVAVHETGHLLGACLIGLSPLPEAHHGITVLPRVQVDSVSIRGKHGGRVELADDDTAPAFRQAPAIYAELVTSLCGQAAEEVVFGQPGVTGSGGSDGAASDWQAATTSVMDLLNASLIDGAPLASMSAFEYSRVPVGLINARGRIIEAELAWARAQARRLMAPERDRLLAGARALFRERRLDPAGVDRLLLDLGIEPAPRAA